MEVSNDSTDAPVDAVVNQPYACGECGACDCKLWRPMSVFAEQIELVCWRCLESKGYEIDYGKKYGSDQVYNSAIGHTCYGPAVPNLCGEWWGYTSVPGWWVAWWKALPNRRDDCTMCCGSKKVEEFDCFQCKGSGRRSG